MNRAPVAIVMLCLLVVSDVAGFATAQFTGEGDADRTVRDLSALLNETLRSLGLSNPGTSLNPLYDNLSMFDATTRQYLDRLLLYRETFASGGYGWQEVVLPGDSATDERIWRLEPNAGVSNSTVYSAYSAGSGRIPSGVDRALVGPVLDLRYVRGSGGYVTNWSQPAARDTRGVVEDFWGPTMNGVTYGTPGGTQVPNFGGTNGNRINFNGTNPAPSGEGTLAPTIGDVNLTFVHRYNLSYTPTQQGMFYDGARVEIRLRGDNGTWSTWVGLNPDMVNAIAAMTDKDYTGRAVVSRAPGVTIGSQEYGLEKPMTIPVAGGIPVNSPLDQRIPGTTLTCNMLYSLDQLIQFGTSGAGASFDPGLYDYCPSAQSQPMNPGQLTYLAYRSALMRSFSDDQYTGPVVGFGGQQGYTGASVNNSGNLSWLQSTYDLSPYVGYEVQVRFRVSTQPRPADRGEGWSIGNIEVNGKAYPADLGVREVLFPTQNEVLPGGSSQSVVAVLRNYGATRLAGVTATLTVVPYGTTGPAAYTATVQVGDLFPQEEYVVTFPAWPKLGDGGYNLSVSASFNRDAPRSATDVWAPFNVGFIDWNPRNDRLAVPIFFRSGVQYSLTPVGFTATPTQSDVDVTKYVNLTVRNDGNVPALVNATLFACRVDPYTGLRVNAPCQRVSGRENEERRVVSFSKNLTSLGTDNAFRTFSWTWTPATRGVYDLVATAYTTGTEANAVLRTYVRASAIPYFSEDFNNASAFVQSDPTQMVGHGGLWTVDRFPFAPSPHSLSGAWVPDTSDVGVRADAIRRELTVGGITTDPIPIGPYSLLPGVTVIEGNESEEGPVSEFPVPDVMGAVLPYKCGSGIGPTVRCRYDTVYDLLAGEWRKAFGGVGGGGGVGSPPVDTPPGVGVPGQSIPTVGVFSGLLGSFYNDLAPLQSSLTFLYGGRMHYYLGHEIRIPDEMFEEGHELDALALEFFHASRMNPNPFQSPASATTDENVAKYRRTYADHDVVLDDLKNPFEEVYGRVLVYPGALLGPAGRNPTVPGSVDSSPGNSIPVGSAPGTSNGSVFINYTDDTAFRRGALATAFGLSSPPGDDPYVLAVYNGTFNWAHENLTIPRSLLNQARNGIVTLIFEYATPPGRVHTTQRCAPDPRTSSGPCQVQYNADLDDFRELWYVDDIGVKRWSPTGDAQTVFFDEVERTSCVRLQAPECPQNENNHEWSASGWRLREWRNPNPALWNITTIAGFVEAADASGTQRSLWWGNRTANPLAYDDNVWSVLRTPAIDLTLASEPILVFKHNFSFAAANPGKAQPQDATGTRLALDGGNVRIRVLEDAQLGLWSRPYLLGDSSQYTHQLFIDTSEGSQRSPAEREFIGVGEKPYVFSGRSDVDDDEKSDWVEARFDLSAFRGRTVRIEFHAFSRSDFITARESPFNTPTCSQNTNSCSVDMGWFIDNIRVQESRLANDVRIAEVRAPVPGELFVGPGTQVPLQILVENVGIFPQTSVSASAVITMTTPTGEVSEVYRAAATLKDLRTGGTSKTLQPNEKALLSLPAWAVPDLEGAKFQVRIGTTLANSGQAIPDDNPANNLVTLSLEARAIHAIRLRNLTLDPTVGDMNEVRKVSVEVVNTGNMVEDFTKFNGLRIRISAREAGDTEWSPIGTFTLLQLRLKEIWRPATPLTWKPTTETTYELKAETEFTYPSDTGATIPGLDGTYTTSLVETRTATRVLSRFFASDGDGLLPATLTASPLWGLREDAPYAGLASWGFPATGAAYPHDAQGILQFGPLNLYAAQSAILTFMHRYDFEAGYDGGIVEWSTDSVQWTPLSQDTTGGRLSSGAPLVSDPAVPLYAYTGASAGWERAFYDLGLNRAFTRNAQIADLSLADLQAQSTVWTRSFTDLGPGGMWRSTGAGLSAGYRYTHYLNLDVDLRGYSLASGYSEGSLRFSDLRNLPPASGGGAPSRFAVRVVDPVSGAELGVLIPESAENDNYRDWQTNNLRLDLASYGGRKVRIQFVHVSVGASQHPSSDYGWFIDNVRVTANRGGDLVDLHGGATGDSIEYANLTAAAAGNWSTAHYREALAAGGARGYISDPSWTIVHEAKGLGWAKDPLLNHLSIPRAGPVDSRLIFPLNLSAAADDVSLYLQGMFSFPIDTVTGRVVGGSRLQVSLVDPTKDPERAPWITVPLSDSQPASAMVTTAPIRGHTPFGTDREQNSAFGPDGEGLGGSYRYRPGDLGLAFNLTQWRGQAVWVSLQAFTPSTNLAFPEWSLTRVLVRAEVLNATNVSFRFRAATDANNDGEGWRVDNLTLVGYKRDIDLAGAIAGLPAHMKVPGGDLPFELVVENRGFKDADVTATLTLRRVSDDSAQSHEVSFQVTNESVLRIPIAGAFTVADSATGVAYRLETVLSVPDGRGGTRKFALPDTSFLAVQAERSGIRVENVTVTPNLASRDDLSPLKVVAVIINDDTVPRDALAYLRMFNVTDTEPRLVNEDPYDRDAAVSVTPSTRKIGPGERATFTWTISRANLPAGRYVLQVTPDAEGLKEGAIARHFELLEGQSFLQLYGYIGNAIKFPSATPSGKFAATPVWWNMDSAWYTDTANYYRLDAFDEGGFGRDGSALHLTARGSRREATPIQNAVIDRVLDLRAWDKAYLSFMHRYSFGERVEVPSDPTRYNEVSKASSGGYLEACIALAPMPGRPMACAQPWQVIHPVAHNERGELVKGTYPDHIVSIGNPPNSGGRPATQNENYNALADSWPAPATRSDLHFVPGFSGQSPGYGVDPSNPEGWVPALFDLSEFKGQHVLVRARAGVSGLPVESNWVIDYLSITPHLPSIGPGQTLSVADGVSKAYRFNLRNDGAVTQDVNVTANRAGIPLSWNFTLVDDQPAGPLAGENRVVRLNPGESRVVTLRVDIPIQRAFESDRRVLLEARNMEDALKGTAAPFALAFKPRAWPDLVVDSIKLREDKPLVDTTQPVTVRIRNTGDLEARNVRVVLKDYYYADPEDITSEVSTVVPLLDGASADGVTLQPFGATTDIVFNWRPRTSGYHVLIVQIDPGFLQTEYNLDNNVMRRVVDVRPPMESDLSVRLDLVRENGDPVTDSVPQGESVTVRLTLRNIGTADAQAVYANIQAVLGLGGDFFPLLLPDPYAVGAAIPAGESRVIETRWTPFRDGTYTLTGQAFVQGGTIPERLHALVPTDPNSPRYSDDNIHTREILVVRTGLKLALDPLHVSGLPGKSLAVPFNLTNSGNAPAAILLEALAPEGFTVFAKRGAAALPEVTLDPGARVDGVLSVSIPPDALAGTYKVTFLARSGGESVTRTLTVDVLPQHNLRVDAKPLTAAPGMILVPVTLVNRGNVPETLQVTLVTGPNTPDETVVVASPLTVAAADQASVSIPVAVPSETRAKAYSLTLRFASADASGPVDTLVQVPLTLTRSGAVNLSADSPSVRLATGDTLKTGIEVSNVGNVHTRVTLEPVDLPGLLTVQLGDATHALDLGGKGRVDVTLIASPRMVPGTYALTLRAVNADDGVVLGNLTVPVVVTGVDYVLTDLAYTPKFDLKPGNEVRLTAVVRNAGGLQSGDVPVAFFVDGHLVNYTTVSGIKPGETATVEFTWTVLEGVHVLWVGVDPHERLAESDRSNNARIVELDGGTAESGLLGGLLVPNASPLLWVALVGVLATVLHRGRRTLEEKRR